MAYISKFKLPGSETVYNLRDSEAQAALAQFGIDFAALSGRVDALHGFQYEIVDELPTPSAETMYKIFLVPEEGVEGNNYCNEYITIQKDGSYTFERVGSTEAVLGNYVPTTRTIAGLQLSANITRDALVQALNLHANVVTGVNAHTFTPAGTVATQVTDGNANVTGSGTGTYTPAGTVSTPTITVNTEAGTVKEVASVGTLPSLGESTFVAPTLTPTSKAAAIEGITVSADDATETLTFAVADTANVVGEITFDKGSFTPGTFNPGTLPTTADKEVVTGASATASQPTFTGTAGDLSVEVTAEGKVTGTQVSATFTGTEATLEHTLTNGEVSVN